MTVPVEHQEAPKMKMLLVIASILLSLTACGNEVKKADPVSCMFNGPCTA